MYLELIPEEGRFYKVNMHCHTDISDGRLTAEQIKERYMAKEYADVIIDISHEALDKVFQYRVPFSLQEEIRPGVRVRIPFGKGNLVREGYVISLSETADYPVELMKEIWAPSIASLVPITAPMG